MSYGFGGPDDWTEEEAEIARLTALNAKLMEAMTHISNMCIGQVAMGFSLDGESIGQIIYEATGKTNPELNEVYSETKEDNPRL